jgi:hypothetical protein
VFAWVSVVGLRLSGSRYEKAPVPFFEEQGLSAGRAGYGAALASHRAGRDAYFVLWKQRLSVCRWANAVAATSARLHTAPDITLTPRRS